jgi:uncharacterized protein YraI
MRSRHWALPLSLLALAVLLVAAAACSAKPAAAPAAAPTAKPLRPTFTPTAVRTRGIVLAPTATRQPTMTPEPTAVAASAATEAPAAAAAPTAAPAQAAFTVNSGTVNVRSGPGTTYAVVGKVSQGQQFDITAKSPDNGWWQFTYNGQPAWVTTDLVSANPAADGVQVAADIPAAPTAAPVVVQAPAPTARPAAPPPPAAPAAPPSKYALSEVSPRFNNGDYITVRCRLSADLSSGIPGTLRVMRNGQSVGEASFNQILTWANGGLPMENRYIYNDGCKVELKPVVEGAYTAVLIEGGQPVSDVASFNVTPDNHEIVVIWRPR